MKPLAPKSLLQQRYLISEIIGKGGMGEVYLATDTRLGNDVALKRTTVGDDEILADAFEREARTLAGLRHPVLPKVSDHFLENEEQFLIMEYIAGEDLGELLKKNNKPFPLNWVLFWADQLLEALTYLHTHQPPIIHRDIKPQNLKLTGENQIVLLDFGLSKNSVGQTRVTTSGSVVGYTPHYAPMEQIRGTGTNAKSDLYALSATLYQLLTNTVPPDALTRADSLLANLPDPLRPLAEVSPEVSGPISDAIMKGMDISQDRRFESAREMQKALRHAYNNMQASMSAETVAFNVGDSAEPPAEVPVADANTEGGLPVPPISPIISDPGTDPAHPPDTFAGSEPPPPPVSEGQDFSGDATEVFDAGDLAAPAEPVPGNVADIMNMEPQGDKTEVLLDHVLPSEGEPAQPATPSGLGTDDDFSVTKESGIEEDFETAGSAVPDATVPLISIEGEEETGVPPSPETSDEPFGAATGAAFEGAAAAKISPPPKAKSAGGGSSTGKYIVILVGIGAVLLLLVGSVAAGLWLLSRSGAGTTDAGDNSTPVVEESVEPTVEETIEQALPTEPSPGEANTNS
ncbi:MAG: protein kinase, partial [Acidobacteriota bacterium]|nr:protein kinase [Acidobacteriota bacterium]